MCTVTFVPVKDTIFITSNRDEKYTRQSAITPGLFGFGDQRMIFPKDADKGGTWISMKENGDAAVLLNGAFFPHLSDPVYRRSRGLIFLDVLATERPSMTFQKIKLEDIEPFTLVLFEKGCLYEFRWDGAERYCKQLPALRPHIWSSATLYDGLVIKRREQWFASFLNKHTTITRKDIIDFHRFSGDGDARNDLRMERDGIYSTVSITNIFLTPDRGSMQYFDLNSGKVSEMQIGLLQNMES